MINRKKIEAIIVKNDIVDSERGGKIRIVNINNLSKDIYDLIKTDKK